LLMASGMERSPQGPFSFSRPVGWNELLKPYGVSIGSDMVYDLAANARVAIQAQFGQVLLPDPFWVQAASTKASPVNAELDAVLLPWPSSLDTTKAAQGTVTPLLVPSRAGGVQETTALLDPSREFRRDCLRPRLLAAQLSPAAPDAAGAT